MKFESSSKAHKFIDNIFGPVDFPITDTSETNLAESAERNVCFSPQGLSPGDQKVIVVAGVHLMLKQAEAALPLQGELQIGAAILEGWQTI